MLPRLSQDSVLSYEKKEDKNIVETWMYDERGESGDLSSNLFEKKRWIVAYYARLFEMIVGVLTTSHTQYT